MIIVKEESGVITLRPGNSNEAEAMTNFFTDLPEGTKLKYGGRSQDPDKPGFSRPHFKQQDREIIIAGTTEDDAHRAFQIRDLCYYGSSTAVVFTKMETDQEGLIVTLFAASPCKLCGKPCTTMARAEWGVCEDCIEKCDHTWVHGVIHGGTTVDGKALDIGAGYFCDRCGIGKSQDEDNPKKTLAEHHAAALNEGLVNAIIYK